MFSSFLKEKAKEAGYDLSKEQVEAFAAYFSLLIETNKQMNLTAITQPEEVAIKHMIDSLSVFEEKYFFAGALVCDVGSGAGFPGIPLKICWQELKIILMDSLAKRLRFLDNVIQTLELKNIHTCHMRAEDAGRDANHRNKYDVVVARAVAPLNVLAEYCLPLVKRGGIFCAMKGRQTEEEIKEAKQALALLGGKILTVKKVILPSVPDERQVIYIKKEKNTADKYPRKAGIPERQPLI